MFASENTTGPPFSIMGSSVILRLVGLVFSMGVAKAAVSSAGVVTRAVICRAGKISANERLASKEC